MFQPTIPWSRRGRHQVRDVGAVLVPVPEVVRRAGVDAVFERVGEHLHDVLAVGVVDVAFYQEGLRVVGVEGWAEDGVVGAGTAGLGDWGWGCGGGGGSGGGGSGGCVGGGAIAGAVE
ncbi:hypothetical protein B7463_g58, partial [Scytalidium lignicola]